MIDDWNFDDLELADYEEDELPREPDAVELKARQEIQAYIEQDVERVFYVRQLQVLFEKSYFHWITDRAIKGLIEDGVLRAEPKPLITGGAIKAFWHKRYRYPKRKQEALVAMVERYSDEPVLDAIGRNGEMLVQEGFSRFKYLMEGYETRAFRGKAWPHTQHNLDYIFEKDGVAYGVEVKNTLQYIGKKEFDTKIAICKYLGLRPVFACRMLPQTWIYELYRNGGFALIMGYQLYPLSLSTLASEVKSSLGLPVDSPRRLYDGTMMRVEGQHQRIVNSIGKSQQ